MQGSRARDRRRRAPGLRRGGRRHCPLIDAFAAVPREAYLGPGPWKVLLSGQAGYGDTPNDDPAHVYVDECIAIDPARKLNNGQPGLHMGLLDILAPAAGEHIVQIGIGTGYYSAILAELVGAGGRVTAIEYDEGLARLATANLAALPQVRVVCADGTRFDSGPADAIYVCAGVTAPSPIWLDHLEPAGRLILPLTTAAWEGQILEIRRGDGTFAARFIRSCGFIPCMSNRDSPSEALLAEAFERGGSEEVRSLRRDPHRREPGCWLHAESYCLSRNPR